jgi:hypothetical protein
MTLLSIFIIIIIIIIASVRHHTIFQPIATVWTVAKLYLTCQHV